MSCWWKAAILDVYRRATTPYRIWLRHSLIRKGRAPVLIFFYHRVSDRDPVPWSLTNRQFAGHIRWLRQRFEMISLAEAQRRIRAGVNERPAVHITFDDGYAENCEQALPLLIREKIPCTYFVTLQHVARGVPFEHDVRLGKRFPVNTLAQLRELARSGIVEIGAHTRSHPDLGQLHDPARLADEVVTSRDELQQLVGQPVRYFAFPFGMPANLNPAAFHLARRAGFEAVVSAYGGYNFPGDDPFHLQRLHGDPELARIKNLATLDPRKLYVRRFDYDSAGSGGKFLADTPATPPETRATEREPFSLPVTREAECAV